MMFVVNKIVFFFLNPLMIGLGGLLLGWLLGRLGRRRCATAAKVAAVVWLWFWATALPSRWIGRPLESHFPPRAMAEIPAADAIVELGGGMGALTTPGYGANMSLCADRVWYAARLWKAGKAPVVVPSGEGVAEGDAVFLTDYGIPGAALWVEGNSRNTEENVKFAATILRTRLTKPRPRILLVTSAWHMRRSLLLFSKYAPDLEVIPVATDYEYTQTGERNLSGRDFVPTADDFLRGTMLFKELLGYWGYRLFRLSDSVNPSADGGSSVRRCCRR